MAQKKNPVRVIPPPEERIGKREGLRLLLNAGYDAFIESGVVMFLWDGDEAELIRKQKEVSRWLFEQGYCSSLGVRGTDGKTEV